MAKHEMDNLTQDAVAARKKGMTYGHYMAYKQSVDTKQRKTAVLKHERLPVCACCGEPIAKGNRNRKYCGQTCADRMRARQRRERQKRRELEAAQREMEENHEM